MFFASFQQLLPLFSKQTIYILLDIVLFYKLRCIFFQYFSHKLHNLKQTYYCKNLSSKIFMATIVRGCLIMLAIYRKIKTKYKKKKDITYLYYSLEIFLTIRWNYYSFLHDHVPKIANKQFLDLLKEIYLSYSC